MLLPGGNVMIGGRFSSYDGIPRSALARIYADVEAPGLRLRKPAFSRGSFMLSVPTLGGTNYFLEYLNSLSSTNWISLPPTVGDGTDRILTDPNATGSQRFYRVRVE